MMTFKRAGVDLAYLDNTASVYNLYAATGKPLAMGIQNHQAVFQIRDDGDVSIANPAIVPDSGINFHVSGNVRFSDAGDNVADFNSTGITLYKDVTFSQAAYAGIGVSINSEVCIAVATTYVKVTTNIEEYNPTETKGFTFADSELTALIGGYYEASAQASFGGGNNDTFHGGIAINSDDPLDEHEFTRQMGASGDIGSASCFARFRLAIGDTVNFKMTNLTDTDNPTIQHLQMYIRKIAP